MLVSAKSLHMYASSAHITRIASPGPANKNTSIERTHQTVTQFHHIPLLEVNKLFQTWKWVSMNKFWRKP